MRPKYIAGPMRSRSNAKFIPHMGNKVPFGMVRTASTYLVHNDKSHNQNCIGQKLYRRFKIRVLVCYIAHIYLVFLSRGFTSCVGAS